LYVTAIDRGNFAMSDEQRAQAERDVAQDLIVREQALHDKAEEILRLLREILATVKGSGASGTGGLGHD